MENRYLRLLPFDNRLVKDAQIDPSIELSSENLGSVISESITRKN